MSIDTQADQRRHTHPAPPRMPPDVEPITDLLPWVVEQIAAHSPVPAKRYEASLIVDDNFAYQGNRSLHVIGYALAAISGALVGFVLRGLL